VNYATTDGTALANTDYSRASGTLTWASGDSTSKAINVSITNTRSTPYSNSKAFSVTLSSPTGGATLGLPSSATVTISGVASGSQPMGQTAASRLLMQGTFGPTLTTLSTASAQTYDAWFTAQKSATPSLTLPYVQSYLPGNEDWSEKWLYNVCQGPDQLRQRMAFALSQILVISGTAAVLSYDNVALAAYYDLLVNDALGNYRTLLNDVTLSPAMGAYLNMLRSDKSNPATGVHADQNYAREVMQLFTVGLVKLNIDGTVQTDGSGNPIPTYTQDQVANLANVFTGWASTPTNNTGDAAWQNDMDWTDPMVPYADHHDTTAKTIIDNTLIPAGGTAQSDLKTALDTLFNHPNVGPFIGKQLIQRLVTSNPSPAYVQRVAQVFNDNGQGVRGDLFAVAKAILTDPEAVTPGGSTYGKLREPLLRLTGLWRAFDGRDSSGTQSIQESDIMIYATQYFEEYPLQSPSVFNFYRPDYEYPGPLTIAGLVAPEFQITNEYTLVSTNNQLQKQAYQFIDGNGTTHAGPDYDMTSTLSSTSVMLHTSAWESYAASPDTLVDTMDTVLMAGQMPSTMHQYLVNYASAVPSSQLGSRVAETAELIIDSPQYAVQR
jgi:uncharacterized protein (DUF1800 family)